jgi:hypothetical protein
LEFHLLTSVASDNAFPPFAPDGKRIAYRTTGRGETAFAS